MHCSAIAASSSSDCDSRNATISWAWPSDSRGEAEAAEQRADLHWEQIGILLGRKDQP